MFILATTEIHKVPATIKSRCQQFAFKRIRAEEIAGRLRYVAGQEGIDLTEDGAALLARLADGGMRDALSLLDQCAGRAAGWTKERSSPPWAWRATWRPPPSWTTSPTAIPPPP